MKTSKFYASILAGLLLQGAALNAADLFQVTIRGTCKLSGDRITTTKFNNASLIREFVDANQPTNELRTLKIAYEDAGDRIVICDNSGTILTELFGFGFPVSVSDATDSQHVRQVFLFFEGSSDSVGTANLTERVVRDGEQNVVRLSVRGNMQFALAGSDTTEAQVCTGTFTVGRRMNITSTSTNEPSPAPTP